MITRRGALVSLAGAPFLVPRWCSATPAPQVVIVFLADDVGQLEADDPAVMPNLALMRAEGRDFPNAFSMASCGASRGTLLTGCYPCRTGWTSVAAGGRDDRWPSLIDAGLPTWAEALSEHGVECHAYGKWQYLDAERHRMPELGFQRWRLWERGPAPQEGRYLGGHVLYGHDGDADAWSGFSEALLHTEMLIALARAARDPNLPMVLYRPFLLPHLPVVCPPGYAHADRRSMMAYMDEQLGETLELIRAFGLEGRTLIIWTSDNGTPHQGKGRISMAGANAPFAAWGPGIVPMGTTHEQMIDFTDLAPTLCALFGTAMPGAIDGYDFSSALVGEGYGRRRTAIFMKSKQLVASPYGHVMPEDGRPTERGAARGRYWLDAHGIARRRDTGRHVSPGKRAARRMRRALDLLPPDRRLPLRPA